MPFEWYNTFLNPFRTYCKGRICVKIYFLNFFPRLENLHFLMQKVSSNKNNSNCKKNFLKIILLIFLWFFKGDNVGKNFNEKKRNMAQIHFSKHFQKIIKNISKHGNWKKLGLIRQAQFKKKCRSLRVCLKIINSTFYKLYPNCCYFLRFFLLTFFFYLLQELLPLYWLVKESCEEKLFIYLLKHF